MYRKRYVNAEELIIGTFIVFFFVFVIGGIIVFIAVNYNEQTYVATVTDKDVKNYNNSSKYLVFTKTEDEETRVFSVEDSLLRFRWNSSDVYGEIEVGKTYQFTTVGFRFEILSMYENIIDFEEISSDSAEVRQLEWALAGFLYIIKLIVLNFYNV